MSCGRPMANPAGVGSRGLRIAPRCGIGVDSAIGAFSRYGLAGIGVRGEDSLAMGAGADDTFLDAVWGCKDLSRSASASTLIDRNVSHC